MTDTFSSDPLVAERAGQAVNFISDSVVKQFKPRSIILIGSFGRGEVTALVQDDNLLFLSDCEIILITCRYIPRTEIDELVREVKNKYDLDLGISGVKLSLCLIMPGMLRFIKPTMQNYDIKYGSMVIYGKNYLDRIPAFRPLDIPFWEGLRLMFNRMAESLNYLPLKDAPRTTSIFWLYKVILACQDTVLLASHMWDPSYKARNLVFQELLPTYYPELDAALPQFIQLALNATSFKLNGKFENIGMDQLRVGAITVCDRVFRWAIIKYLNMEFDNYITFQQSYLASIKVRSGNLLLIKTLSQNVAKLVEMFIVDRFSISQIQARKIWMPWKENIYSLIPLMYFAASSGEEINKSYLSHARFVISNLKDIEPPKHDIMNEYDYLCKETVALWYKFCN